VISLNVDVSEASHDITVLMAKTHPATVARATRELMVQALHFEHQEAFDADGPGWPELSGWRVRDRAAMGFTPERPMLRATGRFAHEVMGYRGDMDLLGDGFLFTYPGNGEASGRYWGLTAGQLVNPLAAWNMGKRTYTSKGGKLPAGTMYRVATRSDRPIPMARVPRPIMFGKQRVGLDMRRAIARYFDGVGLPMTEGLVAE
jgi:hypothetical protein